MSAYSARPCPPSESCRPATAVSSVVLSHTMRREAQSARAPNVLRSVSIVCVSDGGQVAYEPGRRPTAVPRSDGTEGPFLAATARMMMMREPAQDAMPWDRARAPLGRCPFFVFGCPRMDEYAGSATGAFTATRVQATTTYRAGSAIGMALMSHWGRCVKTPDQAPGAGAVRQATRSAPVKRRVGGIIAPHAGTPPWNEHPVRTTGSTRETPRAPWVPMAAPPAAAAPRSTPTCPTSSGTTGAGSSPTASTTSTTFARILELIERGTRGSGRA